MLSFVTGSFTYRFSRFTHVVAYVSTLLLNSILLRGDILHFAYPFNNLPFKNKIDPCLPKNSKLSST